MKPHAGATTDPKSELERLLRKARQEFLDSGNPMLDWDGIHREIAARRGGAGERD